MKPTGVQHVWPLFFLPLVLGSPSGSAPGLATIFILLFILILLLILLVFSWYKLNVATDGQYHPRNLWQSGTVASMAGRWRALWAEVTGESADHLSQCEENMQPGATGAFGHDDIESDAGPGNLGLSENDEMDEDDYYGTEYIQPFTRPATEQAGTPTSTRVSKIPAEDTRETLLPTETKASSEASASSSEALLLGHHALSGSEVWEHSSLEGCVSIHVTAV